MTACRSILSVAVATFAFLTLAGCEAKTQPIRYGQDECTGCKMTLANPRYGAELITAKGKVLKFDDLNCLLTFQKQAATTPAPRAFIIDSNHANIFLPAEQTYFLQHERLRTPMGSHLAAFATETELETARSQLGGGGKILRWADVLRIP